MRLRPRFSLRTVLILVAVISFFCATIRVKQTGNVQEFSQGTTPVTVGGVTMLQTAVSYTKHSVTWFHWEILEVRTQFRDWDYVVVGSEPEPDWYPHIEPGWDIPIFGKRARQWRESGYKQDIGSKWDNDHIPFAKES